MVPLHDVGKHICTPHHFNIVELAETLLYNGNIETSRYISLSTFILIETVCRFIRRFFLMVDCESDRVNNKMAIGVPLGEFVVLSRIKILRN